MINKYLKFAKIIFYIAFFLMMTGCMKENEYGKCIGALDNKIENLEYKLSARNLIIGLFFLDLVIPPVIVFINETYCPIGYKK